MPAAARWQRASPPTIPPRATTLVGASTTRWDGRKERPSTSRTGALAIEYRYAYPRPRHPAVYLPGVASPIVRSFDIQGRLVKVVDPSRRGQRLPLRPAREPRTPPGRGRKPDHPPVRRPGPEDFRGSSRPRHQPPPATTASARRSATVDARGITVARTYDTLGRPRTRAADENPGGGVDPTITASAAPSTPSAVDRGRHRLLPGLPVLMLSGGPERTVTFNDGLALSAETAYDARFGRVKAVRYPDGADQRLRLHRARASHGRAERVPPAGRRALAPRCRLVAPDHRDDRARPAPHRAVRQRAAGDLPVRSGHRAPHLARGPEAAHPAPEPAVRLRRPPGRPLQADQHHQRHHRDLRPRRPLEARLHYPHLARRGNRDGGLPVRRRGKPGREGRLFQGDDLRRRREVRTRPAPDPTPS